MCSETRKYAKMHIILQYPGDLEHFLQWKAYSLQWFICVLILSSALAFARNNSLLIASRVLLLSSTHFKIRFLKTTHSFGDQEGKQHFSRWPCTNWWNNIWAEPCLYRCQRDNTDLLQRHVFLEWYSDDLEMLFMFAPNWGRRVVTYCYF